MFFFFFNDIEAFLKQCLYSDESFEKNKVLGADMVDFYLPEGSRRLDYPIKTVIEYKEKLTSGTTHSEQAKANRLRRDYGIQRFVLISHNIPNDAIPFLSSKDKSPLFKVVDYEKLNVAITKYGTTPFESDDQWEKRSAETLHRAAFEFQYGRNTIFLGAGVSRDAGLQSWNQLLETMVEILRQKKEISLNELDALKSDCKSNYLLNARYLRRYCQERDISFVELLRKALYSVDIHESQLVKSIAECIETGKVKSVITYNYDDLLERELDSKSIPSFSVDGKNRPASYQFPVCHVHGFIPNSQDRSYDENVVLSEEKYHSLYNNSFHWSNIEQLHALVQTTCYFIGLSMTDPNLRRLLDIAQQQGTGVPSHYAFLRRSEYRQPRKAERVFYEMGISVIWYNRYTQLPKLIRSIKSRDLISKL